MIINRITHILAISAICLLSDIQTTNAKSPVSLFSGAHLYELCNLDENGNETLKGGKAACQSYIAGVIDYHTLIQSLGTSPSVDICIPDGTTLGELQFIVWKYLKKNTQHSEFIAAPAVALALFEKYPCKEMKKNR